MGIYHHLFYGGTIKKEDGLDVEKLNTICNENRYSLIDDGSIYIIDSTAEQIDIGWLTCFYTDKNNNMICHYQNNRDASWLIATIDKKLYDTLINQFIDFEFKPKWLRCEFYSGNMTSSYASEVMPSKNTEI